MDCVAKKEKGRLSILQAFQAGIFTEDLKRVIKLGVQIAYQDRREVGWQLQYPARVADGILRTVALNER